MKPALLGSLRAPATTKNRFASHFELGPGHVGVSCLIFRFHFFMHESANLRFPDFIFLVLWFVWKQPVVIEHNITAA